MTLSRDELEQRLMAYVDGELLPSEASEVEQALASDPELAREVAALRSLTDLTRVAFEPTASHVATVDFSLLQARIDARLELEDARGLARPVETETPSLGARIAAWWRGFFAFERPFALAGFAAVTVAVVGTMALREDAPPGADASASVADSGAATRPRTPRRGPEAEVARQGRGAVRVESVEVTDGRVFVEGGADETDKPLVLWHVVDGEESGAQPAAGGL